MPSPCFEGYQPAAIQPALFSLLLSSQTDAHGGSIRRALLRLECFLQITGQTLRIEDLEGSVSSRPLELFLGACDSGAFGRGAIPVQTWYFLNVALKDSLPKLQLPSYTTADVAADHPQVRLREEFLNLRLNQERVEFWRGWHGKNSAGRTSSLRLWKFHERFGSDATQELCDAAFGWYRGRRDQAIPLVQELADFASSRQKADFKDPISLGALLRDFFVTWLSARAENENDIANSVGIWRRFVQLLEMNLFGQAWAHPLPAIPRPKQSHGNETVGRIAVTERGVEVQDALLTAVPLHISDSQAFQLIFKDISADYGAILKWAKTEVDLANARLEFRKERAKKGIAYGQPTHLSREERFLTNSNNHLNHASATFESSGLSHLGSSYATAVRYPKPYPLTTWELGLPLPHLLLAYGTILVDQHPQLTSQLLADFNLYDAKGNRTGLQLIDDAWVMTGFKLRRGSSLAEQKIKLTPRALEVVLQIELMTEPLRLWLRQKKRDTWRLLFLSIASVGRDPKKWNPNSEAHRQAQWLSSRMEELVGLDQDYARSLASRFSLRRVRATRGVLIYIETSSLEAMARALGHRSYNQNLLDRYLPKAIQDFFTERWVRLFQTGIICEALRDSPHLQEAGDFDSAEDLNTFLEHHMLKKVPVHIDEPDASRTNDAGSQLVFGLSHDNLTLLKSVEIAVRDSPAQANALANRWAGVSERLFAHLLTQTEQPDLCAMARNAALRADPSRVRGIVCA